MDHRGHNSDHIWFSDSAVHCGYVQHHTAVCPVDDHDHLVVQLILRRGRGTYQVSKFPWMHAWIAPGWCLFSVPYVRLKLRATEPVTFENPAYRCLETHDINNSPCRTGFGLLWEPIHRARWSLGYGKRRKILLQSSSPAAAAGS